MDYDLERDGFVIWLRWTDSGGNPHYVVSVESDRQKFGRDIEFANNTKGLAAANDFARRLSILLDIAWRRGYMGTLEGR